MVGSGTPPPLAEAARAQAPGTAPRRAVLPTGREPHHLATKTTRNIFGHHLPVSRNSSVPGMAAMPFSTSAGRRSFGGSSPEASI